ncbi:protein kinase family protein [Nocardioides psychrotolerans]|uniref:protein kinase family protein n=1 Tax=Nocardioides psychrotolerans TaxID=1005945 RepID=UPI003137B730
MPHSIRPGDVLADRYRLVDLLTESGGGRFWRAHDRVLERHVALHVIAADDARAPGLLEAARRSAMILDRRILRVLDADTDDGLVFVVNEWGSGTSLDILVAGGPLLPRRAAWVAGEVADSVARAHEAGVTHGRLVPENVMVDRNGEIRVIGFSVDAAMHGLTGSRVESDIADLAGLLYCGLTGRWAGVSASAVPRAPAEHGEVLRPRQVRAGVPRSLDALCDAVLHASGDGVARASARHRELIAPTTASEISLYLADYVGDPVGISEALLAGLPAHHEEQFLVLPAVPDIPARDSAEIPAVTQAVPLTGSTTDADADLEDDTDGTGSEEEPAPPAELATQAGLPIFDDDNDDVSWLESRTTPPPPPPPFEEPPERPLFAPAPASGEPARRPRPGAATTSTGSDFWPWESATGTGRTTGSGLTRVVDDEPPPGRSWLRLAMLIAACLLLLVAMVVAYNLGRGKTVLGTEPAPADPTPSASASTTPTAAVPLGGLVAEDLDPQGTDGGESPEDAPLVVDGDPATTWTTSSYNEQFGPAGLKTGVGLTIDLNGEHTVSSVALDLVGSPTSVSLYVTEAAPDGVRDLEPAVSGTADGESLDLELPDDTTGRFLVVWLTALPLQDDGRFRGSVAEVTVRGE